MCGSSLDDAAPVEAPPTFQEQLQAQWADKRVRLAVIIIGAVLICGIVAIVVTSLMQDAALRENARAVAEGEATLIQSTASSEAGICSLETDAEWFFAESDLLSVVKNKPDGGWLLEQSSDGGATWNEAMSGSGTLLSAYLVGDQLFYSIEEGGSASTLRSQTTSGAFADYSSATNIAAISATNEMVVTKSVAGKLGWLNIGSGIWHDLQGQVEAAVGQSNVRVNEVRAFGAQAIASLDTGQVVVIDVNGDAAFVAGAQEG